MSHERDDMPVAPGGASGMRPSFDPEALIERVRVIEHIRYAARAVEQPAILDEAEARLRQQPQLSAGERVWLALLERHRSRLPMLLLMDSGEARLLRSCSPLPAIIGVPDANEQEADLAQARAALEDEARVRAEMAASRPPAGPPIITFMDFAATSSSNAALPLEAGWATVDANNQITSGSLLIRPKPDWTDWCFETEALHGISRELAEAIGWPAAGVAAHLNEMLQYGAVFCEYPDRIRVLANQLYARTGRQRRWRTDDAARAAHELFRNQGDREYWQWSRDLHRSHCPESNAYALALAYTRLRQRHAESDRR